jgi:hypothetical protein
MARQTYRIDALNGTKHRGHDGRLILPNPDFIGF